jgi:hypothetical protein
MSIVILGWLSAGLRLALWALACWCLVAILDRLNNDPFSKDKARLNRSAMAIALYRGLRWAAILVGSALILS